MKSHELARKLLEMEDLKVYTPKDKIVHRNIEEVTKVWIGNSLDVNESGEVYEKEKSIIIEGEFKPNHSARMIVFKSKVFCSIIDFSQYCNQKLSYLLIWLGRK